MPRPKVHESQRQRAAEACSFCRESKKKCSGAAPCTQCLRRGLPHECHITYLPRGFRSRNKHNASTGATRQSWNNGSRPSATSAQETGGATLPSPSNVSGSLPDTHMTATAGIIGPLSPSESRDGNDDNRSYHAGGSTATAPLGNYAASEHTSLTKPGPRMLLSSHGERVYVGAAASIAFLQTVRRVVAGQIGPTNFSQNMDSEKMLEIETPQSTDDTMDLTVEQKLHFLQCYFSVTEAFIDIFDPAELEACITSSGRGSFLGATDEDSGSDRRNSSTEQSSPLRRATLDLALAIGAQCTSKQDSQNIARALFRKAQRQALSEMIQDPDLDMVRTYLLMAFYMLGECRRNTAYMYLSVAARAAIALGLHSPSSYSRQQPLDTNDKLRLRVWMTCRVGDKLVNSLLGRPATTIGILEQLDPVYTDLNSGKDHGLKCMVAAYRIVSIIDEINTKLYSEQDVRPAVVEQLLQSIDTWKRDCLPSLQPGVQETSLPPGDTSTDPKQGSVGILHVSCLYYFAVILATRPVFISALTLQQGQKDQESPMSDACLDAAVFLAQTCVEALDTGLLASNMCIMKALVFAAGLVLGVRNFAKPGSNFETERAFEGAKRVLSFLATRSPQASHYLDILTSLSNAIAEQRSRTEHGRANRYVSRLFSFGSATSNVETFADGMHNDASGMAGLLGDSGSVAIDDLPSLSGSPSRWPGNEPLDPELFIDWETVNISHWDNFPFSI